MIVPCIYDAVFKFSEGLACVWLNNKVGYINEKGEIVIPFEYDGGWDFKKGVAPAKKNEKWGYINAKNEVVVPFTLDLNKVDFLKQEETIETAYSTSNIKLPKKHYMCDNFSGKEDLIGVENKNGVGFMDKTGKIVIPCRYLTVSPFEEGLAIVCDNKGKRGMIDKTGKIVIPFIYNEIYAFKEGLASVEVEGKHGFIDKTGKVIIPLEYEDTYPCFSEGLVAVSIKEQWGFIDKTGKMVIPCIYSNPNTLYFRNGLCKVVLEYNEKTQFKDGYINREGIQYWED
jgi:hypothetical protein